MPIQQLRGFRFNGLCEGACLDDLARDATELEISPVWFLAARQEMEITSTDQAQGWSIYLRHVTGKAQLLHNARTMVGAARALEAAERSYGFPVTLAAWDMQCTAESLREFPAVLRRTVRREVAFRLRDVHAGFALAAWVDLARHQVAVRGDPQA